MKLTVSSVLLALASLHVTSAVPAPAPQSASVESFAVTRVSMAEIRADKEAKRATARANGVFAANKYPSMKANPNARMAASVCTNGKAANTYSCGNVDLHGFVSHQDLGSKTREGNDIWGWTSPSGREFVAVGATDGKHLPFDILIDTDSHRYRIR